MKSTYYKFIIVSLIIYAPILFTFQVYDYLATPLQYIGSILLFMVFFTSLRIVFVFDRKNELHGYYIFKKMQYKNGRTAPLLLFMLFIFYFILNLVLGIFLISTLIDQLINFSVQINVYTIIWVIELILICLYLYNNKIKLLSNKFFTNLIVAFLIIIIMLATQILLNAFDITYQGVSFALIEGSPFWRMFTTLLLSIGNYICIVAIIEEDYLNYKLFLCNRIVFLVLVGLIAGDVIRHLISVPIITLDSILFPIILSLQYVIYLFFIKRFFKFGNKLKITKRISKIESTNFILINLMLLIPLFVILQSNWYEIFYILQIYTMFLFLYIFYKGFKISSYKMYALFGLVCTLFVVINHGFSETINIVPVTILVFIMLKIYKNRFQVKYFKPNEVYINKLYIVDENSNILFSNSLTEDYSTYSDVPTFLTKKFDLEKTLNSLSLELDVIFLDDIHDKLHLDQITQEYRRCIYVAIKGVKPKVTDDFLNRYYWCDPKELKLYDENFDEQIFLNERKIG